jgi:hypothetical protein
VIESRSRFRLIPALPRIITNKSRTVPLNPAALWQGCHSVGLWYADQNAISYAKFYSRSHDAVIRVRDAAGNVIETHEHAGDFNEG